MAVNPGSDVVNPRRRAAPGQPLRTRVQELLGACRDDSGALATARSAGPDGASSRRSSQSPPPEDRRRAPAPPSAERPGGVRTPMAAPHEPYSHPRVVTPVVLSGHLDRPGAARLERSLEGARAKGAKMIVVDLREVTSIEAVGLGALQRAEARCRQSGVRLRLLVPGRHGHEALRRAFEVAGLVEQGRFTDGPQLAPLGMGRDGR